MIDDWIVSDITSVNEKDITGFIVRYIIVQEKNPREALVPFLDSLLGFVNDDRTCLEVKVGRISNLLPYFLKFFQSYLFSLAFLSLFYYL